MWKLLCPRLYVDSIFAIPLNELRVQGIRGLIFDLDNTLTGWDRDHLDARTLEWFAALKEQGFRVCLVSNNKKERVATFGRLLGVPAIHKARKPRRQAFQDAMEFLQTGLADTAVVGDQIFTDVLGGNRLGLYTILVTPISKREFVGTRIMRQLEKIVLWALARRNLLPK